jgi:hypothetical protein
MSSFLLPPASLSAWFQRFMDSVMNFITEHWLWVGIGVFVVIFVIACAVWVRPSR